MVGSVVWVVGLSVWLVVVVIVGDSITGADVCCCHCGWLVRQCRCLLLSLWVIVSQVQMFVVVIVDDSITGADGGCCQPY